MKKPPKANKAIATYFTAKRMEDAGLLRPGTALLLASSPTKTVKRFPERMVNRMKTSRGGGQGGVFAGDESGRGGDSSALLLEDESNLLLETGDRLLLET